MGTVPPGTAARGTALGMGIATPVGTTGAGAREVVLRFPNGVGYRFTGADYLTRFALPNFLFHATTAYAILRSQEVSLGKPDFLQHLGPPEQIPEA